MDIPIVVDGDDSFVFGMDSYTLPSKLNPGEYVSSMNTINRGGLIQTRPGSISLSNLPAGNLQGCKFFTPKSGIPCLISAVDGRLYVSQFPFTGEPALIPNIQFAASSRFIAWATCTKFTEWDYSDGTLRYLDNPYSVLIIQDGSTRAAYYDGSNSGHLNPTPSNSPTPITGLDQTPIGLWMAWSGNRLWVSRGPQIFASDIGDPMSFTESKYLNEGRSFYIPGNCTGIAETADLSGIICFTEGTGTFLQSSIQDRTVWLSTPGFQREVLTGIGCVSARSIVKQYGFLWWHSAFGLISQDSAMNTHISSRIDVEDNEMAQSKFNMAYDMSGVCGAKIENFIIHGVPYADKVNTRVHVLDVAPFEGSANTWPSFWTGWNPVEFANAVVYGKERVFTASADKDGVNRLWELFKSEKTDNGTPITSYVATRQHFFGNRDYKKFRYVELELAQVSGDTAMMVAVAGTRGAYQKVMEKDMSATNGQVYYGSEYGYQANLIAGSRLQSRIIKTTDNPAASECNSGCVESEMRGLIDKAFSVLIVWSGIAGVSAYRVFAQGEPTRHEGSCEDNETGQLRLINEDGCGYNDGFGNGDSLPQFYATVTFTRTDPSNGTVYSRTSTRSSSISQVDADRKALTTAEWYVLSEMGEIP
jgi:hypothetical protein